MTFFLVVGRGLSEFILLNAVGCRPLLQNLSKAPTVEDLGMPVQGDRASANTTKPSNSQPVPIVEAQGWMIGPQRQVVLTAHAPIVTPHIPWLPHTSCDMF